MEGNPSMHKENISILLFRGRGARPRRPALLARGARTGANGVSPDGVTANFMFSDRLAFLGYSR